MIKKFFVLALVLTTVVNVLPAYSATVLKDKEEAKLFKKDSIYSDINVQEYFITNKSSEDSSGLRDNDDALNKFTAVTATKSGNTYTNTWSNYKLTVSDQFYNANDIYDFYADGIKYDFGIYFTDYSRIAVYYSRLSRDLNIVCANFAPGVIPDDVEIAGAMYKHVALDVPYPYGIEKYNYYLRVVDGKLMVIETFHEDNYDISRKYIERFEKAK